MSLQRYLFGTSSSDDLPERKDINNNNDNNSYNDNVKRSSKKLNRQMHSVATPPPPPSIHTSADVTLNGELVVDFFGIFRGGLRDGSGVLKLPAVGGISAEACNSTKFSSNNFEPVLSHTSSGSHNNNDNIKELRRRNKKKGKQDRNSNEPVTLRHHIFKAQ
uniref:Uncharacterized protein n=1 Tax=Lygus hesperus TaxID=30085 RepID=A0A0A9Y650_LYGHE